MDNSYKQGKTTQNYLKFLKSPSGQFFQEIMFKSIFSRLEKLPANSHILDAGCGTGWLAYELKKHFHDITAFDSAGPLLEFGKRTYPDLCLDELDLTSDLPYPDDKFDAVVLSMVLLDLPDHGHALKEIKRVLKPGGLMIATTVNPYYGFPVAEWKRGWKKLFGGRPKLTLTNYFAVKRKTDRTYTWAENITSKFYTLPEHINSIINSGLTLSYIADLESLEDEKAYGLKHQLYRFPTIILVEAKK